MNGFIINKDNNFYKIIINTRISLLMNDILINISVNIWDFQNFKMISYFFFNIFEFIWNGEMYSVQILINQNVSETLYRKKI